MRAPQKADWREERRKRAWKLKELGWQRQDIAIAFGVSEGAVSQWLKRGREQGVEALNTHPGKGANPRLTPEQSDQMPALLTLPQFFGVFRGWKMRRTKSHYELNKWLLVSRPCVWRRGIGK